MCVLLDDDTIPGKRWLENCHKTIQEYEGLLGNYWRNLSHTEFIPSYE